MQGENFDEHEYLSLDRTRNLIIKNVVDDSQFGCVWDCYGKQTREVWSDKRFIQDEIKNQKYRFILVLNGDFVKGIGAYSRGNDRNSYLTYKALNKNRR